MNLEEQIKALAELDGICLGEWLPENRKHFKTPYLTSYDAIIPLIQKQSYGIVANIHDILCTTNDTKYFLRNCSPTQLCEALLRATGKWKE